MTANNAEILQEVSFKAGSRFLDVARAAKSNPLGVLFGVICLLMLLLALLGGYQAFSRHGLPPNCRFWPSCSEYARQALLRHGAWGGLWLAGWRLLHCHPWGDGGPDPVPEALG